METERSLRRLADQLSRYIPSHQMYEEAEGWQAVRRVDRLPLLCSWSARPLSSGFLNAAIEYVAANGMSDGEPPYARRPRWARAIGC